MNWWWNSILQALTFPESRQFRSIICINRELFLNSGLCLGTLYAYVSFGIGNLSWTDIFQVSVTRACKEIKNPEPQTNCFFEPSCRRQSKSRAEYVPGFRKIGTTNDQGLVSPPFPAGLLRASRSASPRGKGRSQHSGRDRMGWKSRVSIPMQMVCFQWSDAEVYIVTGYPRTENNYLKDQK